MRGRTNQLAEKVGNATVGDVSNKGVEKESPGHRIHKGLLHLVYLEVLISDSLLVDSHSSKSKNAIFLLKPPGVELAVRDNPEEEYTQANG